MQQLLEDIIRHLFIGSWKGIVLILVFLFIFFTRGAWYILITSIKKVKKGDLTIDMEHPQPIEPKGGFVERETKEKAKGTVVIYKIAQHFPDLNTKPFDFLKDWKVWFLIENREMKKYNAYIRIKFITSDNYEKDAGGHYGGEVPWRLNALGGVIAPGLGIPEEIREKVRQGGGLKIRILGKIKDENNNLIEEKLPVDYIYDRKNNSWYYEP